MKAIMKKSITLAITGASGAPYALRLLEQLVAADYQEIFVLISSAAKVVFATEENVKIPAQPDAASEFFTNRYNAKPGQIRVCGKEEWFAPVASGSAAPKQMVVCPCSTGTLSAISIGACDNLIGRSAQRARAAYTGPSGNAVVDDTFRKYAKTVEDGRNHYAGSARFLSSTTTDQ